MDAALVEAAYAAWDQRDVERLVELTHPEVEIAPLVLGVTSIGPWHGHDGVRKLLEDARSRWAQFDIVCEEVLIFGECAVALVRIAVAVRADSPTITGEIAHLIEFEDGLVKRFAGYRDRAEAIRAAEAGPA